MANKMYNAFLFMCECQRFGFLTKKAEAALYTISSDI